jgi:hypothetical protein
MENLINKYQEIKNFKLPLEIDYILEGTLDNSKLITLNSSILKEAEIRSFTYKVKIEIIKNKKEYLIE